MLYLLCLLRLDLVNFSSLKSADKRRWLHGQPPTAARETALDGSFHSQWFWPQPQKAVTAHPTSWTGVELTCCPFIRYFIRRSPLKPISIIFHCKGILLSCFFLKFTIVTIEKDAKRYFYTTFFSSARVQTQGLCMQADAQPLSYIASPSKLVLNTYLDQTRQDFWACRYFHSHLIYLPPTADILSVTSWTIRLWILT